MKAGDTININFLGEIETVTIGNDFKAGLSGVQFVTLNRKVGAPYCITMSRLLDIIV